jgi:hypothetical protein
MHASNSRRNKQPKRKELTRLLKNCNLFLAKRRNVRSSLSSLLLPRSSDFKAHNKLKKIPPEFVAKAAPILGWEIDAALTRPRSDRRMP